MWIHMIIIISRHLAIYFGSPFGRFPTFHTLTSVGRKQFSVCLNNKTLSMIRYYTLTNPQQLEQIQMRKYSKTYIGYIAIYLSK